MRNKTILSIISLLVIAVVAQFTLVNADGVENSDTLVTSENAPIPPSSKDQILASDVMITNADFQDSNAVKLLTIETEKQPTDIITLSDGKESTNSKDGAVIPLPQDSEKNIISEIISQLSAKEQKILKDTDPNQLENGYHKYVIAKGSSDGKLHLYIKQDGKTRLAGETYNYTSVDVRLDETGNGKLRISASGKDISNPYLTKDGMSYVSGGEVGTSKTPTGAGFICAEIGYVIDVQTFSPLILDTNKDGKVMGTQGMGVDLNGDSRPDGAATCRDKMLAMSDFDGDGKITGKEVFGDQTFDPFTNKALNAKNGFDALKMVAKITQSHTGTTDLIDENGQVDINKLNEALQATGKTSFGLISESNTSKLEGLDDVSKISTCYSEQQAFGDVQHRQLGTYTDKSGQINKVDDVWFKAK